MEEFIANRSWTADSRALFAKTLHALGTQSEEGSDQHSQGLSQPAKQGQAEPDRKDQTPAGWGWS